MALTKAFPRMMEGVALSVKDFGATGDGVTDDTAAFQAAVNAAQTNGLELQVNPGTYRLTNTITLNDGSFFNACSLIGMGGVSKEPLLVFDDGVEIGLRIRNSKATQIKNIRVSMGNVTNNCVGILVNAMWESMFENVIVSGPGATDPSSGQVSYGIALRPTYNGTVTPKAAAVALEAIQSAQGINMGVYWNTFNKLDVSGFGYGLIMLGEEGGTNPRTNQNQFNQIRTNSNYHGIWIDDIGGGNVFISSTSENSGGDAVRVENVSGGTGPVWIGGELSGSRKWVGPGMLLNAVAGTNFPEANSNGETATHIRFTDQAPQVYGTKFTGAAFLSDFNTKQDVFGSSSVSYPTDNATVNLLTLNADNVAKIFIKFVDLGFRQGVWAAEYSLFASDAIGAPGYELYLEEIWQRVGSDSWNSPVFTVGTSGNTVTFSCTNANTDMDGTVFVDVVYSTGGLTLL